MLAYCAPPALPPYGPDPRSLQDYEEIPWKVVRVLVTDINYGGRVTDDRDRRCMSSMIKGFACDEMLRDGFALSPSGDYTSIPAGNEATPT